MTKKQIKKVMLIAGEASGDSHGADLVRQIRANARDFEIDFFGSVGEKMVAEGVGEIVNCRDLAIVGIAEIIKALPIFLDAKKKLIAAAKEKKPDAVVLIDFPEFNLKIAKDLKRLGCKIIYYISPQLWAWRQYRIRTIKKHVDLLISILPFEKDWYRERGVNNVEFAGNPLTEKVKPMKGTAEFRAANGFDDDKPLVALLPGSRGTEIRHIFPVLAETVDVLADKSPEISFVVCTAPGRDPAELNDVIKKFVPKTVNIKIVQNDTYNALNAADAAVIASGTATLEAGLIGVPMVIVYKGTELNYKILRPLISVEHFGLVNLIAGKRLAKELIQKELNPQLLFEEITRLLIPQVNKEMREELSKIKSKLTDVPTEKTAGDLVLDLLRSEV